MRAASGWERWIALLLRAYPRAFRAQFGADLAAEYPAPDRRVVRAAVVAAWELVRGGLGARWDDASRRRAGVGLDGWLVDLRQAIRGLVRRPLFTATIVATLALAASLNAAVFGILDATLLRPLPYPGEDSLVSVGNDWTGAPHASVSVPEYLDFDERARSFQSIALYSNTSLNLAGDGASDPARIQATRATPTFFEVLGVPAALGRTYTNREDSENAPVIVLSHAFWQRRFGGDPAVVGRTVAFDSGRREIVGVMPEAFRFPSADTDVWVPMNIVPADTRARGAHTRTMIARLRDGVPLTRAQDEMRGIARHLQAAHPTHYPDGSGWSVSVLPLRERLVGDLRAALHMLAAAVAFVLLIACANVANVLVARGTERSRELATRTALGAPRGRLVRQAVLEGLLAGAAGGYAGLLLAAWLLGAVEPWLPDGLPRPGSLFADVRVSLFALAVTAVAGGLAAVVAVVTTAPTPSTALRSERASPDAPARRLRTLLTGAEIALSVVLLVASGLAFRSFVVLLRVDPGLSLDGIATARVSLSAERYPDDAARAGFFVRAFEALARQPGVASAGAVSLLPLSGQTNDWTFGVEGWVPPAPNLQPDEQARAVFGDYFRTLDIRLVGGRFFDARDTRESPHVAIVSEGLARKYWRDGDALGRRIRLWGTDSDEPWATVVGIVADIRHLRLSEDPVPILYFPGTQVAGPTMTMVAKVPADYARGPQVIADAVRAVDPQQPVWAGRMMEEWADRSIASPRFNLLLLAVFGVIAVALAAVGVYGVTAFAVSRRTRELGIRVALGAHPRALMAMVLRESLGLAAGGLVAGAALGIAAGRYLATIFYQVRVADPAVFAAVAAVVLAVAIGATYVPARRAMRVDPVVALRSE